MLTCDQELCLLVAQTEQGKADLQSGSLWSLARHTTGTASSHLGMGIQKQVAGGGEVETSLEEGLSGQEQVDHLIIWLNSGGLYIPGRLSVAQIHKNSKNNASVCLIKYEQKIKIVLLFNEGRKMLKMRMYTM